MTVLNSFCFDFALRLRTAGTNVSFTCIQPMPVPPVEAYGLNADDFGHILGAFPGVARKRPGFMDFLYVQLAEWETDA